MISELRASHLPMAFQCPGSVRPATIPLSEDSTVAALGRAAHEALRPLAEDGACAWESIASIAATHGANAEDVRMLCAMATKLWPSVKSTFREALTEIELSTDIMPGVTLTGHVDVLAYSGNVARVADWKTGRKDHDYAQQMRAYAALALLEAPELEEVTSTIIWLRDGEIENYTMTREVMRAWVRELIGTVIQWDGVYHPGKACDFCPRSHECEAANAVIRRDIAALTDQDLVARAETSLATMTGDQIVELHRRAELVTYYADRVRRAIKTHVLATGDVEGGGVRLTIETSERRRIDPVKAWPVLEAAGFLDEDFAACMDLHVSRVEKVIATKAGRGKGAGAVRDLSASLEEANAVTTTETQYLKEKRTT